MNRDQDRQGVCPTCRGEGTILRPELHQLAQYAGTAGRMTCPACEGSGLSSFSVQGVGSADRGRVPPAPSPGAPPPRPSPGGPEVVGRAWRAPGTGAREPAPTPPAPVPPRAPERSKRSKHPVLRAAWFLVKAFVAAVVLLVILNVLAESGDPGVWILVLAGAAVLFVVWLVRRRARRSKAAARGKVIEGYVRGLQQRQDQDSAKMPLQVLSFWVDSRDRAGDRRATVVQMRGRRLIGSLNEGDLVRVRGRPRTDRPLEVKTIENLTTGGPFRAKGSDLGAKILQVVMLLFTLAFVGGILFVASRCPGPM